MQNNNKSYKERKSAADQSKWDHYDYEMLQKEEDKNFTKGKHTKHKNNENSFNNNKKYENNTLVSDKYRKIYTEKQNEKQAENDGRWKHV